MDQFTPSLIRSSFIAKLAEAENVPSLSSQLDSVSKRIHEASPTTDPGQQKATRLRKLLPPLAKGAKLLHPPLLAIIQSARSRRCRRWATIAFSKLLQAGYPFCFRSAQPDVVKQLLDNMALLLPTDASAPSAVDEAIYIILCEATTLTVGGEIAPVMDMIQQRASMDYRDIIATKHEAFLRRAETLLRYGREAGKAGVFISCFHVPSTPASCPVGTWMRFLGVAIDLVIEGPAEEHGVVVDGARKVAEINVDVAVANGRDAELFAAIEEHLVPRVGRLVEVMTTSQDVDTKRGAMNMIGCMFSLAHPSYEKHYANSAIQARVDEVLSEPVRVLLAHPCALKTMASLLKTAGAAVDVDDEQAVTFNIIDPMFIPVHLSEPSFHKHAKEHVHAAIEAGFVPAIVSLIRDDRLLKMERLTKPFLMGCTNGLLKMSQCDEKVARDKTVASVCCDLLAKHARGDIDILMTSDDTKVLQSPLNNIMSIISEFVAYGDRQVERGKIATNVFRIYVFKVFEQLDLLYKEPSKYREERDAIRTADAITAAFATGQFGPHRGGSFFTCRP
ncbi:unnamed protein product [Vitrella brassicaformis CCMP3155]|uniref:Uncharacterized protein n=1 Tax=Vitrella brassicaformis (strain CCMP3155) TaxID=1169540 RepID=A0A0G4EQ70_VITBC|nr:unnamed protein product [Vitrella brassicaformis CCMP3155]|eukprot:CEL99557.1 unnamed protein product [Vitrella brassicaformis CCMP3155]